MNFKIIFLAVFVVLVCQALADSTSKHKSGSSSKSSKPASRYHHVDAKRGKGKGTDKRGWWWCWWCYPPAQNGAAEEPPPPEEPEAPEEPPPENGGGGARRRGKAKTKKSASAKH